MNNKAKGTGTVEVPQWWYNWIRSMYVSLILLVFVAFVLGQWLPSMFHGYWQ